MNLGIQELADARKMRRKHYYDIEQVSIYFVLSKKMKDSIVMHTLPIMVSALHFA